MTPDEVRELIKREIRADLNQYIGAPLTKITVENVRQNYERLLQKMFTDTVHVTAESVGNEVICMVHGLPWSRGVPFTVPLSTSAQIAANEAALAELVEKSERLMAGPF